MQLLMVTETLNAHQSKKHIPHHFEVPAGATRLDVKFNYGPTEIAGQPGHNLLSLSVFDPEGPRGAGHCREDNNLTISAHDATPGYLPGALQPGQWTLMIDSHMILEGGEVTYNLAINISSEPLTDEAPVWVKGTTAPRGAGWYRGDLHGHTIHSDANWDVPEFAATAKAAGLDFVTLSDHNTVSPLAQIDSLSTDQMLTMGGIELTTYYGHALALGIRHWIDWRPQSGKRTIRDMQIEVEAAGGTFIIAHPKSVGDPICTGCRWEYIEMMPGTARNVEIWNGGIWHPYNEEGLQLWYEWLNQGYRMRATAGTDIHGYTEHWGKAGLNVVYAESLSEQALLAAIRLGHNYVSNGPRLEFTGRTATDQTAMMGDLLPAEETTLTATWSYVPEGSYLRLLCDGAVREEMVAVGSGTQHWVLPSGACRWAVLEVRGADGLIQAVTNPIFFGEWQA